MASNIGYDVAREQFDVMIPISLNKYLDNKIYYISMNLISIPII